ncbi:tripartite tricarboxylate transporter substrate binding protein [Acidovorax sp. Be4]|uniref:Tripartite tricarboxylate transporter substrate binding protein n=1 Tax=Acidovorax bellezanensis TaxID=2976702 RepID=A0ABT2PJG5_9BURK|nr:tripartite tricarboxylate transporter substrate binding protein [Acidovorax sp. Be4]MCT9810627.1 tripartite tricarboxylate transporter substrate binding protein [Acidovorax sp. Be4]
MKTSIHMACRFTLAALLLAGTSLAQAWPERVIKIIVPAPPGGNMDVPARVFAHFLSKEVGFPVIVENKAGAGGSIGVQAMLNAPADGHTILYTSSNVLTEIPHVMKVPYDPMKDVRPVVALAKYRYVLVVAADYPANDLAGMARLLKAEPDKSSFASPSPGTIAQFGGEILNRKLGVNMQHVPFSGTPPALNGVMSRQITMYLDSVVTSGPLLQGGKLKALAIAGSTRYAGMAQVPTFAEQGYPEFSDFSSWQGIAVSPKVPAAIVDKLYATVQRIAGLAPFHDQIARMGFEPVLPDSSQQFAQRLQSDHEHFGALNRTFALKQ